MGCPNQSSVVASLLVSKLGGFYKITAQWLIWKCKCTRLITVEVKVKPVCIASWNSTTCWMWPVLLRKPTSDCNIERLHCTVKPIYACVTPLNLISWL